MVIVTFAAVTITNGVQTPAGAAAYLATVATNCNAGYQITGASSLTCTQTSTNGAGVWSASAPTCAAGKSHNNVHPTFNFWCA